MNIPRLFAVGLVLLPFLAVVLYLAPMMRGVIWWEKPAPECACMLNDQCSPPLLRSCEPPKGLFR